MAGFNDVLKSLGFATGAVTGGPSQVKSIGAVVALNSKVNSYLYQFGQKIGGLTGSDAFESIAKGAQGAADAETKAFLEKNVINPNVKTGISLGLIAILAILIWFIGRK